MNHARDGDENRVDGDAIEKLVGNMQTSDTGRLVDQEDV